MLLQVPLAMLLAGCAATVPGAARPAPLVPNQVAQLVEELYAGIRPASDGGLRSLAEYVVTHNHPAFDYTVDECIDQLGDHGAFDDSMRLNKIPRVTDLVQVTGWAPPEGRYAGDLPEGEVYEVPVIDVVQWGGSVHTIEHLAHVAVLDGRVWFFQRCER